MKLSQQQSAFTQDVVKLLTWMFDNGYAVTFAEAYRTPEQAAIYAKDGRGIKDSLHCQRLAIDLNLFKDGNYLTNTEDYEPAGIYWESLNPLNKWGGRFTRKDGNHFERKPE